MGARRAVERGPGGEGTALRCHVASVYPARRRLRQTQPRHPVRSWHRPARARVGDAAGGLDPGCRPRLEFPPCAAGRPVGTPWRSRLPPPSRGRGPGRHGVLQPGDPPARRGPARDTDHGREPGRPVRRSEARRRGDGPLLHPVAGPLLHRELRGLLPSLESRLGTGARLSARGTPREALAGFRPPRRSRGHAWRRILADCRGGGDRLRKPVSLCGWLVQVASVGVGSRQVPGPDLRGRARHQREQAGRARVEAVRARNGRGQARAGGERGAARPAGEGAGDRKTTGRRGDLREGRVPRQHEPRDPHAA